MMITMAASTTMPTMAPINTYRFIHEVPVLALVGELVRKSLVMVPEAGMMMDN